jgi:hypothetical protein
MIAQRMNEELKDLDDLIGLAPVKQAMRQVVRQLVNDKELRAQKNVEIFPARRHLVFSGPAGTGKRQVARLFGELCFRLGALAQGHMVVVDRADLGGESRDEKVTLMRMKCGAALDGILYVRNEAFLAAGILRSTGDLRLEPVDVMIEFMAKHQRRVIVILDARPNQLQYISFHSGLARRFPETIDFPAYDAFELVQLLAAKARRAGLQLPDGIEADLFPWIVPASQRSNWRNAQEMAALFAKAIWARELRIQRERCQTFGSFARSDFKQALLSMQAIAPNAAPRPNEIHGRMPMP